VSAAARELPGPFQVGLVVHLYPFEIADRRNADAAAAVGELLEPVLVVERWVTAPGRLQRIG
jgi:hypothetical protein